MNISMSLYNRTISEDMINRAMRHIRNKGNRTGSFTKSSLQHFAHNHLGLAMAEQSRDSKGRFGPIVGPSDRFADRLMQKLASKGAIQKLDRKRDGNVTHWKWVIQK